jgi:hypothetical protein
MADRSTRAASGGLPARVGHQEIRCRLAVSANRDRVTAYADSVHTPTTIGVRSRVCVRSPRMTVKQRLE